MPSKLADILVDWLLRETNPSSVQNIRSLNAVAGSSIGIVRTENQDKVLVARFRGRSRAETFCLYSVCDGLGGMQEGAKCAGIAVAALVAHLITTSRRHNPSLRLLKAAQYANTIVYQQFKEKGGTTLAAVLITPRGAGGVAVGDTRIYAHREDGSLDQLTVDDTIAGRLAELQQRSISSFDEQPFSGQLAQYIGQQAPIQPQTIGVSGLMRQKVSDTQAQVRGVLICSDGVHRIEQKTLKDVARTVTSSRDLVFRLIRLSEWSGGSDNAAALYISAASNWFSDRSWTSIKQTLEVWDGYAELAIPLAEDVQLVQTSAAEKSKRVSKKPKKSQKAVSKRKNRVKPKQKNGQNAQQRRLDIEITEDG